MSDDTPITFNNPSYGPWLRERDLAEWCRAMPADAANEIQRLQKIIEAVALHGDPAIARGAINWKRK